MLMLWFRMSLQVNKTMATKITNAVLRLWMAEGVMRVKDVANAIMRVHLGQELKLIAVPNCPPVGVLQWMLGMYCCMCSLIVTVVGACDAGSDGSGG